MVEIASEEFFSQVMVLGFLLFVVLYFIIQWTRRVYREYKKTCLSCGGPRREGFNPNSEAVKDVLCKSCCDNYVAYLSSL